MSSFITTIPLSIRIEDAKEILPKESHIENVTWNGKELELRWGNGRLITPYTFHVPFSVDQLKKHELPDKVTYRAPAQPTQAEPTHTPVVPNVQTEAPKKKGRRA